MIKIEEFKKRLDKLPYLPDADKFVACYLFAFSEEKVKKQLVGFYEAQSKKYQLLKRRESSLTSQKTK